MTDASDNTPTLKDLWNKIAIQLGDREQARRIVEQVSGRFGTELYAAMNEPLVNDVEQRANVMVHRRLDGEPLQYVLGSWDFRQLTLSVDRRVLIPRPETEQLVEAAMPAIAKLKAPIVVDLGTGSGAIALSIAHEIQAAIVYGTDKSTDALEVAQLNLAHNYTERVSLLNGSWFSALPDEIKGRVDLIISNPPYIAEAERHEVETVVSDWEPPGALFSGEDGLDDIRLILNEAPHWLSPGGSLFVELAPSQADNVALLASRVGFESVEIGQDFTGRKRWIAATLNSG